jgi:hypothetical protein
MRKTLIALAATTGLVGLGTVGASAAPVRRPAQVSNIQQADWYCGPRCEYWRHRHWEARREWREHHPYYSYNNGYYGYGYYHQYH